MEKEMTISLLLFLVLTAMSSSTTILKSMFLTRRQFKAHYIVAFVDALLFATVMKRISMGDSLTYALAYAVGTTLGSYIGSSIEARFALGNVQVDIRIAEFDKMVKVADDLRDKGYRTETTAVFAYGGVKKYKIYVTTARKYIPDIKEILRDNGYENPVLIVRDVANITGDFSIIKDGSKDENF